MSENPSTTMIFCEERKRLDHEFSRLLATKATIREQIANQIIAPAQRRATLLRTNEMIDDVIALSGDHHKHCSCERTSESPEPQATA